MENKELNFLRLSYLKEVMQNLPAKPERVVVVKAPKDTAIISHQKENSDEVEI
jgi:hypothetical protein